MNILGFIIGGILFLAFVGCAFVFVICDPRDGTTHRHDDDSGF